MVDRMKTKPKHAIRTVIVAYRFGSMRAGQSLQEKRGTARKPAKLPTSLDELHALNKGVR